MEEIEAVKPKRSLARFAGNVIITVLLVFIALGLIWIAGISGKIKFF